jgi:hypothetical protein
MLWLSWTRLRPWRDCDLARASAAHATAVIAAGLASVTRAPWSGRVRAGAGRRRGRPNRGTLAQGDRVVNAAPLSRTVGNRAAEDSWETQLRDEQSQAESDGGNGADQRDRGIAEPQEHAVAGEALARFPQSLMNLGQHFSNHRSLWRSAGAQTARNPNIAEAICRGVQSPAPTEIEFPSTSRTIVPSRSVRMMGT